MAFVARGKAPLGSFLRENNAELDVIATPARQGDPPLGVAVPPPAHSCGCDLVGTKSAGAASIFAVLSLVVVAARRRARSKIEV